MTEEILAANTSEKQPASSKDYATVMAHFYRGELGRMTIWRQRFDTTTHWAIVSITGIITFAWTTSKPTPFLFILANIILYLLLTIEARRYRFYDAYRARVRVLEAHFIFPVLSQTNPTQGNWRKLLGTDLLMPSFKISFWEALHRRFNRNYVWLFIVTFLAWITHLVKSAGAIRNIDELKAAIELGQPLPWYAFLGMLMTFYTYLTCLGIIGMRNRRASGKFIKPQKSKSQEWTL